LNSFRYPTQRDRARRPQITGASCPVAHTDASRLRRKPTVSANRGSNAGARHCTKQGDNAHKFEELEVLYRWHPWFGRVLHVHEVIDRQGGGVLHCSPDGDAARRWLELPKWRMFDRACRYCAAHSLENVSCGCIGRWLVRRPSMPLLLVQGGAPATNRGAARATQVPPPSTQGSTRHQAVRSFRSARRETPDPAVQVATAASASPIRRPGSCSRRSSALRR